MAGMTDYTGVDLPDILSHLSGWASALSETLADAKGARNELAQLPDSAERRDGEDYALFFEDLLTRYAADVARLSAELPAGVHPHHVVTARQLYRSAESEERRCVSFKQRNRLDVRSDADPPIAQLSRLYRSTRDMLIDLKDMSNLAYRLEALAGAPQSKAPTKVDAFELKPNFFGIGLNLNHLIERWRERRRK
jgi:hypothetical protein